VLFVIALACGTAAAARAANFTVTVGPALSFSPAALTINANDTVTWTWTGTLPHSTTSGSCGAFTCTPDGNWDSGIKTAPTADFLHQFTTTGTFPYYCSEHGALMTGMVTVNALSAVTLRSLAATRVGPSVVVRWRTASSLGTLGFNVFRSTRAGRVRVNRSLIPVRAAGTASYSVVDRHAPRSGALQYLLQSVDLDGTRSWHGPVVTRPR
jgi:plastocyanin